MQLGGGTGARWYRSIYVIPGRITLEKWLVSHGLEVRRGGSRSRRVRPNDLGAGTSPQYGSDDDLPSRDKPYGRPQGDGDDDEEEDVDAETKEGSPRNSAGGSPHKRPRLASEPSPLEQLSAVAAAAAVGLIPAAAPFGSGGSGGGGSDSSAALSSHRLLCSAGAAAVPLLPPLLPEPLPHSGAPACAAGVRTPAGNRLGAACLGQPAAAATDRAQADENARILSRALQLLGQYQPGSHHDSQRQQQQQQQQLLQQSWPASGSPLSPSPTHGSPTNKINGPNLPVPGNARSGSPTGAAGDSAATAPAAGKLTGGAATSTVGYTLGPTAGSSSSAPGAGCKSAAPASLQQQLLEAARAASASFSASSHSVGALAGLLAAYPAPPGTPAVANGPSVQVFRPPAASSRTLFLGPPFANRQVQQLQAGLLQDQRGAEGKRQPQQETQQEEGEEQQRHSQGGKELHDTERSRRPSSTSTAEGHHPCGSDRSPSRTLNLAQSSGLRGSPHGARSSWPSGSPHAGSPRHPDSPGSQQPAAGTSTRTPSDAAAMPESPLEPHAGWRQRTGVQMWPDRRGATRMQHSSIGGGGGPPPGVVLLPRPLPRLTAVLPMPCLGGPRPVHDARFAALQSGSPMAASTGSPRTPVAFVPRPLIAPYGISPAPGLVRVSPDARVSSSSEPRSSPSGLVLGKRAWAAVGQTQASPEQGVRTWEPVPPAVQAVVTSGQGRPMGLGRPVAPGAVAPGAGRLVAYDRLLVESGWGADHPPAGSPRFSAGEGAGVSRHGHCGSPSCSGEVHHPVSGHQLRGRQVGEEEEQQQRQQQGWSFKQQRRSGQGVEQAEHHEHGHPRRQQRVQEQQREACGLARGSGSPSGPSQTAPRVQCRPMVFVPPFPPPGNMHHRPQPPVTYVWPGPRPGSAPAAAAAAAAAAGAAAPFAAGGGRGLQRPVYVIPMPYAPHVAAPQGAAVFARSRPAPPGLYRTVAMPPGDGAEPFADEREYSEGQHEQRER